MVLAMTDEAMERLAVIEAKLDALLAVWERFSPLADKLLRGGGLLGVRAKDRPAPGWPRSR